MRSASSFTFEPLFIVLGIGALVAYVGSAGLVEIAVRDGSAALRLGVGRGAPVRMVRRAKTA